MTSRPPEATPPETETTRVLFFCKDCRRLVHAVSSKGRKKYTFKCAICNEPNVAYGSEKSIVNFFRIKPHQLEQWLPEVDGMKAGVMPEIEPPKADEKPKTKRS
jgi:hypothetical protein